MLEHLSLQDPSLITRLEAAHRLDVSLCTVDKLVREGKLRPIRQGRKWVRFRVEDINAYIRSVLRKDTPPAQSNAS